MSKSVKRGSPGADAEKNGNPLQDVDLSDENQKKLQELTKEVARVELVLERAAQKKLGEVYTKRREILKGIPKFWPGALVHNPTTALHMQHTQDQIALSYLEDVWVARDPIEPRTFTIEFHFKENPYFSDAVLKKEYKYLAPSTASSDKPDADGITESMLDFSWDRDVAPQATTINWKEESKNLVKLFPQTKDDPEDDLPEPGSFFNWFTVAEDPFDIGVEFANSIFPDAIEYFLGNMNEEDIDSDEEEESGDEGDEEIDLEKPRPKKQKN